MMRIDSVRQPGSFFGDGSPSEVFVPGDDRYSRVIRFLEGRYPAGGIDVGFRALSTEVRAWMRKALTLRYSWAIPSPEVLDRIVELTGNAGLVEAGAGTGYWASLLDARGVDVLAFDACPPGTGDRMRSSFHATQRRTWHPVIECDVDSMPWNDLAERTLFLCWPPYAESMGADALTAFAAAGGRDVIYIGEGDGGCTGDDVMWSVLEGSAVWDASDEECESARGRQMFREVEDAFEGVTLPQWDGLYDYPRLFRRGAP